MLEYQVYVDHMYVDGAVRECSVNWSFGNLIFNDPVCHGRTPTGHV